MGYGNVTSMTAAVIGRGIGGTAVAIAFLRAGVDVHVYEQAPEQKEVGAGIQISPNASRLLYRYGLEASLEKCGMKPVAIERRRRSSMSSLRRAAGGNATALQYQEATVEVAGCTPLAHSAAMTTNWIGLVVPQRSDTTRHACRLRPSGGQP
jgi:3-hydroxyacyl-CoA dehydrogenase